MPFKICWNATHFHSDKNKQWKKILKKHKKLNIDFYLYDSFLFSLLSRLYNNSLKMAKKSRRNSFSFSRQQNRCLLLREKTSFGEWERERNTTKKIFKTVTKSFLLILENFLFFFILFSFNFCFLFFHFDDDEYQLKYFCYCRRYLAQKFFWILLKFKAISQIVFHRIDLTFFLHFVCQSSKFDSCETSASMRNAKANESQWILKIDLMSFWDVLNG